MFHSINVHFDHLCSLLPMKRVHKCVDELQVVYSCNYILITQQRLEGASISSFFFSLEILVQHSLLTSIQGYGLHG